MNNITCIAHNQIFKVAGTGTGTEYRYDLYCRSRFDRDSPKTADIKRLNLNVDIQTTKPSKIAHKKEKLWKFTDVLS